MVQMMEHYMDFSLKDPAEEGRRDVESNFVLILLNYRLPSYTRALWNQATLRICADGGANRLYDELPQHISEQEPQTVRQQYLPDVIKGDLDSVRPDVREFYSNLGL